MDESKSRAHVIAGNLLARYFLRIPLESAKKRVGVLSFRQPFRYNERQAFMNQ